MGSTEVADANQPANLSPVKAAKRARYRHDILAAAEALFAEHGVDGTRIETIAAAAGIAPRTLYTVFASKQEVVAEVSEGHRQELMVRGRAAVAENDRAWPALLAVVQATCEYYLANPHHLRHELREARFWGDERSSESSSWAAGWSGYVQLFERAMADGDVWPGEATGWARALLALQQSQMAHWVASDMHTPAEPVLETLLDLVRHAFELPHPDPQHHDR